MTTKKALATATKQRHRAGYTLMNLLNYNITALKIKGYRSEKHEYFRL